MVRRSDRVFKDYFSWASNLRAERGSGINCQRGLFALAPTASDFGVSGGMSEDIQPGFVFGELTVVEVPENSKNKVICKCSCGKEGVLRSRPQLRANKAKAVRSACKTCIKIRAKRHINRASLSAHPS